MSPDDARFPKGFAARLFIFFGLTAPIVTFAIAVSGLSVELKVALVAAVAVVNTLLYFGSRQAFKANDHPKPVSFAPETVDSAERQADHLSALAEAGRFFDASNDQSEMFALVASRVNDVFPFEAALLLRPSPTSESMDVIESTFEVEDLAGLPFENCLSGLAYLSGEIEIDQDLNIEKRSFQDAIPKSASGAAAIPLIFDGRILAVFEIFAAERVEEKAEIQHKLEQIRDRITPLFLASFASDRSISTALTDSVTEIPNERAFHLVLENQIAESQRFRDERPLTVVAIDLKSFRVVNQQYGHATGDAILSIAAARIRGQLRKMDFLSRFDDDEFVAVLPLVDEKFVEEVASRLRSAFKESKFHVGDLELAIDLNIGSASFWQDGETPQQLIQQAQLRKQQAKAADPQNVVLFPKEYVN